MVYVIPACATLSAILLAMPALPPKNPTPRVPDASVAVADVRARPAKRKKIGELMRERRKVGAM